MRIRKRSVIRAALPEDHVQSVRLRKVWFKDEGPENSSEQGKGKAIAVTHQPCVVAHGSKPTSSPSAGDPVLQPRLVKHVLGPRKSEPEVDFLEGGVSKSVQGNEEGSKISDDQLWKTQEDEHVTRHYVRRSNIPKGGDGPAMAQFESRTPAARMGVPEIDQTDEVKQFKSHEELSSVVVITKLPESTSDVDQTGEGKSDKNVDEEQNHHPSIEPEGSLLHTLYLQLLAAGSEGFTIRELFASFKKQTSLPSLASDWKEQVRDHLKRNAHFTEVKGRYFLLEQYVPSKSSPVSLDRFYRAVSNRKTSSGRHVRSLRTTVQSPDSAAFEQPAESMDKHEGVQTRRRAYVKTIEAVLNESAVEFHLMQQRLTRTKLEVDLNSVPIASPDHVEIDPVDSHTTCSSPPTSRKRKSSSDHEQEPHFKIIRGNLQAIQAKIVAENGVQRGVPCSRKDDGRKWRCPLMAMEGDTLCEHHRALRHMKKAKRQQPRNTNPPEDTKPFGDTGLKRETGEKEDIVGGPASDREDHVPERDHQGVHTKRETSQNAPEPEAMQEGGTTIQEGTSWQMKRNVPGALKTLHARMIAEGGVQSGKRCSRKDGANDCARKWQCPLNALEGNTLCAHHNRLRELKKARYAAERLKARYAVSRLKEARQAAGRLKNDERRQRGRRDTNVNSGLPASNTQFDDSLNVASRPIKLEKCKTEKADEMAPLQHDVERRSQIEDTRGFVLDEKLHNDESTVPDDGHLGAKRKSKDDGSNCNQGLPPQVHQNASRRRYVAAKKTASNGNTVKVKLEERKSSPLIRPPTIPPLPAINGTRRKAVKNRSLMML